jgi:solute carrier family 41
LPQAIFDALPVLVAAYLMAGVCCFLAAFKSPYTREIMVYGWAPVIASMFLSNLSGPIAENSQGMWPTFARFQVVMNGAGGNLGAIFCSKMTTDLMMEEEEHHQVIIKAAYAPISRKLSSMGHTKQSHVWMSTDDPHLRIQTSWVAMHQEQEYVRNWVTMSALMGDGDMRRFARMLLLLILPGQAIFACVVVGAASSWSSLPSPLFLACFILASLAQVTVLLMAAQTLVVSLWRNRIDPDNGASPLICGLGDLTGTAFMTLAYWIVSRLGGEAWPGNL